MAQRIRTSNKTAENLDKIQNKFHFSSKAVILRLCLALSLNIDEKIELKKQSNTDKGFDISLSTLFGEYEVYFKTLIRYSYKQEMTETTYIRLIQAHIERGMIKLYGEFATTNGTLDFIEALMEV